MTKNKKIFAGGSAVVLALVLSGCGGGVKSSEPAPVVTKTVIQEVPAAPEPVTPASGNLADSVRAYDSWFSNVDDATINDVAMSICGALQGGASVADVIDVASTTIGIEHAPAIIAGAIAYDCPDQSYKVQ